MNYFKLVVFCKLVELKKGAAVAKELGITPSTVSFHIQSLEKELGMQLFYKKLGNFILTSQGEVVYHYSNRILHLQDELLHFAELNHQGERGAFRIGVSGLANQIFLPKIINDFNTLYPQIRLSVSSNTSPEIEQMLVNFQLDYGILLGSPKQHPELHYEKLGTDCLELVYGQNHPFSQKETIEKEDILNQKILFHEKQSSTRSVVEKWLNHPVEELNVFELDSITTMKKVLAYGQSVAFISKFLVEEELTNQQLISRNLQDKALTRTIYLVKNKEHFDDAIATNFRKLIHELPPLNDE